MSDQHTDCTHFEDWLIETGGGDGGSAWAEHLSACAGCREQWAAHQMLVGAFAGAEVPELSPSFDIGLERKLEARVHVAPLKGWRLAALVGYAAVAVALLRWIFTKFPLPSISVDTSSPWTMVIALLLVPLTLWLTAVATKILPSQRPRGMNLLSL